MGKFIFVLVSPYNIGNELVAPPLLFEAEYWIVPTLLVLLFPDPLTSIHVLPFQFSGRYHPINPDISEGRNAETAIHPFLYRLSEFVVVL